MEFAASRKLITQESDEPWVTVERARGELWKTGALKRMPATVRKKWRVQGGSRTGPAARCYRSSVSFSALVLRPAIQAGVSRGISQSSTVTYSISWNDREPSNTYAELAEVGAGSR